MVAENNLVCYKFSLEKFDIMKKQKPDLSVKLLTGISKELSTRLRVSNYSHKL